MAIQEKFPSIRPSLNLDFANTKTLDPRITFNRSSTATYYDGKTVAKAEENLFLWSQEFGNSAWVKGATSVSANVATAPDGTTTADKIVEHSTSAVHAINQTVGNPGSVHTVSLYVKSGGRNFALIGNTTYAVSVDLTTGVVSVATGSIISAGSQDAGNGWWRVYFTVPSAPQQWFIYTSTDGVFANRNYLGDGTSGILVWGAQLEQRPTVAAYSPTTNQPITNYIPVLQTAAANVARFDHNPVTGESLGLLIEEQRTNLLTYSEQFNNAVWVKPDVTVTANSVISPDGTLSGDLVKTTAVNSPSPSRVTSAVTSAGVTYTYSVWLRADTTQSKIIQIPSADYAIYLATKNIVVTTEWQRFEISFTGQAGAIWHRSASVGETFYIWGAQLEAGAFPTSYIKTEASQVTRSADSAVMTGTNFSSWYRADEGTLFASATRGWPSNPIQNRLFVLDDVSTANRVQIRVLGDGFITGTVASSSTTQADLLSGSARLFSAALAYKYNDFALVSNGGNAASDASGVVPNGIARALIGGLSVDGPFSGHIRKIAYYPRRLTNTQLQALTS